MSFPSVKGGYHYVAEILDGAFAKSPSAIASKETVAAGGATSEAAQPVPGAVTSSTPVVASETITTQESHRAFSVGVEEAWSSHGKFGVSGYGYVPVSQAGPDQLYQLQKLTHAADQMTFSTLAIVYPLAACPSWLHGLGLGLGPTFFRGGTAEVFRQWNARIGYEVTTDLLLTLGASLRNVDVPTSTVGSVISVPKPAAPPAFATRDAWEPLFSVSIAVDLDVITRGVAAVSAAASGSSKGSGGK